MDSKIIRGKPKQQKMDYAFLSIALVLLGIGLALLYSASTVISFSKFNSPSHYFVSQLQQGVVIGLVAMYACSRINYHFWQKFAVVWVLLSIFALLAVLFLHKYSLQVGNARRWLVFGSFTVQPAEFAKLALVIYIAAWIAKHREHVSNLFYGILPLLIAIGIIAGLVIMQPDIGTMLVIVGTAYMMFIVGGVRAKHLIWIMVLGLSAFAVLVKLEPYRLQRFLTFLHPSFDPQGIGYQINQALLAIGSAGVFGHGYGNSRQKYNFLPEVMGDSIFAVTVEELGFLRAAGLIFVYIALAFRGLRIAKAAPDLFGRMLVTGIIVWISLQALINIGAIIGLLPLTGVPLPFVSYGSSSLIVTLAAIGIILNVSKHKIAF